MNHRRFALLALVAAIAALAVAGCGGGDESSTSTTAGASGASGASGPLTVDQWATQADQICAQGDKDQNAAVKQFFQENGISTDQQPTDAQIDQLANDVIIPNIQQQIDAVKALPVPEDDAEKIQAFLDQAQSDLDKLKSDPSVLTQGGEPFAETQQIARDLGLDNCASSQ
jgi:basic membrane lipoprotein Med (substrate-binding protein (PBP1-ABC) superfamily)